MESRWVPTPGIVRGLFENLFKVKSIYPFDCSYQYDSLRKETWFVSFPKSPLLALLNCIIAIILSYFLLPFWFLYYRVVLILDNKTVSTRRKGPHLTQHPASSWTTSETWFLDQALITALDQDQEKLDLILAQEPVGSWVNNQEPTSRFNPFFLPYFRK